jgi:3-oxoacyl-[acyl-carrier-protein] synthase-3
MHSPYCASIEGTGFYVPEKVVSNDDLSTMMDTSDKWIQERTGIRTRRIAPVDMGTSDLAVNAARQALDNAKCTPQDIDLILAATLSPDHYFPGIGVLIQNKLGCGTIPAIDIRGQCSGFTWAISTATAFLSSGTFKKALIIGAEIHSRIIEFSDRGRDVSVLFGDGAGAIVMQGNPVETEPPSVQNGVRGVIDSMMGSDGSGANLLSVSRPGLAAGQEHFISGEEAENKAYLPFMHGRQVGRHATHRMAEACRTLLERNSLEANDLDLLVPHQANLRLNEMVREKLGLPPKKVFNNIQKYGNTTAATLPICLSEATTEGRLKRGDLVMTVAFGAGFTWGANLIRW